MDTDNSYPLDRPPPQQSGSVKKTARMSTSSSAKSDDTDVGAASLNQTAQQPRRTVVVAKQAPEHAGVSATSTQMIMPVRGGPPTASIQTQSNQVAGDILDSDVYLSARKLLAADRNSEKDSSLNASGALDATVAHSHFAELLGCLKSQISAGGHDDLLSDVMLPGLALLVSLIEQTRHITSKATNLPTASTAPSAETTTLAFRAHPAKSSAVSSSSVSAATSTSKITTAAPTASLETTTLALRSHPINSSAFSTPVSASTAQPFQFPSLPHDVKIRVLSFVPETDVALNCRLVCSEFRDLVNGNELQIAQLVAQREHSRLQSQIDMRRQIMPTSLTDFVFDAGLWVQWRGFCPVDSDITLDSFTAWRLSPNRHKDMFSQGIQVQPHNLVMWGILTDNLMRLQLDLQKDLDACGEKQVSTLQDYAVPRTADCSKATLLEYQRLCFMIWDHADTEPFFGGQEHDHANGEKGTFPKLRLSKASYGHLGRESLRPVFPAQDIQELGLPELKDPKFFYYFGNEVPRDVFRKIESSHPSEESEFAEDGEAVLSRCQDCREFVGSAMSIRRTGVAVLVCCFSLRQQA